MRVLRGWSGLLKFWRELRRLLEKEFKGEYGREDLELLWRIVVRGKGRVGSPLEVIRLYKRLKFLQKLKVLVKEELYDRGVRVSREDLKAIWEVGVRRHEYIGGPLKLVRAYKRLRKRNTCGRTGHIVIGVDEERGEIVEVKRANHSCRSVLCPYCQVRESRKRLSRVLSWFSHLLESGEQLSFITLTIPSSPDIFAHIAHLKRAFERFYQMRIGVRAWEEISREFYVELRRYARHLHARGVSRGEIRKRVRRQLYFFQQFEKYVVAGLGANARVKDLFRAAVWKFELTYNEKHGYHGHFHGITTVFMPKLLLTVLVRRAGLGAICDIRRLSGKQGLVELAKYETKYWELDDLPFEEQLAVEVTLMGFRKFRVWGEVERYQEEENIRYFPLVTASVDYNGDFIADFKRVHRKKKPMSVSLTIHNDNYFTHFLRSVELSVSIQYVRRNGDMDPNGEIDLTGLLGESWFLNFLRSCLLRFMDFIEISHPDAASGFKYRASDILRAIEREIRGEKTVEEKREGAVEGEGEEALEEVRSSQGEVWEEVWDADDMQMCVGF